MTDQDDELFDDAVRVVPRNGPSLNFDGATKTPSRLY